MQTAHLRNIVKMGHSCGLTLPAEVCREMKLALGSKVSLSSTRRGWLLQPVTQPRMSLKDRIAKSAVSAVRSAGGGFASMEAVGREVL